MPAYYVGLDGHKARTQYCPMGPAGEILAEGSVPATGTNPAAHRACAPSPSSFASCPGGAPPPRSHRTGASRGPARRAPCPGRGRPRSRVSAAAAARQVHEVAPLRLDHGALAAGDKGERLVREGRASRRFERTIHGRAVSSEPAAVAPGLQPECRAFGPQGGLAESSRS